VLGLAHFELMTQKVIHTEHPPISPMAWLTRSIYPTADMGHDMREPTTQNYRVHNMNWIDYMIHQSITNHTHGAGRLSLNTTQTTRRDTLELKFIERQAKADVTRSYQRMKSDPRNEYGRLGHPLAALPCRTRMHTARRPQQNCLCERRST
jgi:hypothetical protein